MACCPYHCLQGIHTLLSTRHPAYFFCFSRGSSVLTAFFDSAVSPAQSDTCLEWLTRACLTHAAAPIALCASAHLKTAAAAAAPSSSAGAGAGASGSNGAAAAKDKEADAPVALKAVADEDLVALFEGKVLQLAPSALSGMGMTLLQTLLLHVNTKNSALVKQIKLNICAVS